MTHQLFLTSQETLRQAKEGDTLTLAGDEGRHAASVVRMRAGERCYLSDGAGRRVLLEAESVAPGVVTGRVVEIEDEPEPTLRFGLVQALAKGDRDEQAVEACTELGVDEVIPWQAERSIVVWRGPRAAKSLAKWAAVVTRATKQSRRARMPLTSGAVDLTSLGDRVRDADLTLVLHEDAGEPLASVELPDRGEVLVVVGPEGGITDRELAALTEAGATPVRLGSTILRSSSAGPAALAVLMARTRWT